MQIFSSIVAGLALLCGLAWILLIREFTVIYEDLGGVALPGLTAFLVESSGWIPGGLFLVLGVLLALLLCFGARRVSPVVAVFTLVLLVGACAILPVALMRPLTILIEADPADTGSLEVEEVGSY